MDTSPDKQSLRTFLADTVPLLCKNFLHFESEFSVEGLIGITLDQKDVFLISIHETVKSPDAAKLTTSKSAGAESLVAKSTSEFTVTAACNVALPQSIVPVEDVTQDTAVSRDSTNVEMLQDIDIAKEPVARQPVILLPDDVKECGDSTADVKLEVGSVRSIIPGETLDGKMYDRDTSSRDTEQIHDCVSLPPAFDSHAGAETVTSDNSKTFEKIDYSEKSSSSREGQLVCRSSGADGSTSSDGPRAGFSQSGDFEVIEIKEESLSEDEFIAPNQSLQLGVPPLQMCGPEFSIQGVSSAMDTTSGVGYSYWEGNPVNAVQAMNQSKISVSASVRNSGGMLVKRGPKTKKWKFYECLKCGSKLTTAYGLKKHDTVIHQGNYKFTCHLCGKGLRTEYNLRGHMASRHNMSKDYRCTMCTREFGYRHTLRDHMLACHGVTASADMESSGLAT